MVVDNTLSESTLLGHAVRVLLATDRSNLRMATLQAFVVPPVRLRQISFVFNSHGDPIGYATWSFLTRRVSERLSNDPSVVLRLDEWNEGDLLWIMDIVSPAGKLFDIVRAIALNLDDYNEVRWIGRKTGRETVMKIS